MSGPGEDLVGRSLLDDAAIPQHDDVIGEPLRDLHVVCRDEVGAAVRVVVATTLLAYSQWVSSIGLTLRSQTTLIRLRPCGV